MKTTTNSRTGRAVLMASHCAGMVDMVALPVWVGTLIAAYGFDAQQGGGIVTLFLAAAVVASMVFAPRFNRLSGRVAATIGFGAASLAFLGASLTNDFATLAVLHVIGGFAAGTGLSFTHGTIGRSANPHRLFGMVGLALGIFAVPFLGATPPIVAAFGGSALFAVFALVMAIATALAAVAFPTPDAESEVSKAHRKAGVRLPRAVWFGIVGVSSMALVQAMIFSFIERMGADRGFSVASVSGVLVALGLVNMFPAGTAALLEKRIDARTVVLAGPMLQAVIALVVSQSSTFAPYAVAAAVFVSVMLFTHTFAFGRLAALDVTGRAVAATPAMVMIGSAMGPIIGGTIVKEVGYGGLGVAALAIDVIAVWMFALMTRRDRPPVGALA
jgi:predicted MFS family arabinose efflux permease